MKRFFALILAILLLTPSVAADVSKLPTMTVTLSAKAAKVGSTVRVTASVKDAPPCASYHIIYSYDTNVLKPIEGKNISTGGIFTTNINPKDVGTINTVAADSNKILEGNAKLFYTDFEVIGAPKKALNTALKFTYLEFYTTDIEKVINLKSSPCSIPIIPDPKPVPSNPKPVPSDPAPNDDVNGEENNTPADTPNEELEGDTPESPTPNDALQNGEAATETDVPEDLYTLPDDAEGEDPTGDWTFDEEKKEATVTDSEGNKETYTYEEIIDPDTGDQSGVVLYDEEGDVVGKLRTKVHPSGDIQVIKQFMTSSTSPILYIIPILLAVVGCIGLVIFYLIKRTKQTSPSKEETKTEDDYE